MTSVPDKELSDLLDFSAMFYPPVPSGADPCKGTNDLDSSNFHGFKSATSLESSNSHWSSPVQLQNSCYDAKGFEGPGPYHPSTSVDVLSTFSASADQSLGSGKTEEVFSRSYPNRNAVKNVLARSSYLPLSVKRPATDDIQSGRGGGKYSPDTKRMKSSSTYSQGSDDFSHEQIQYQSPSKLPAPMGLFGSDYQSYPDSRNAADQWSMNGDMMTPSSYLSGMPPNFGALTQVGSYNMALRSNLNYSMMTSPSSGLSPLAAFHDSALAGDGGLGTSAYSCSTSSDVSLEPGSGPGAHAQISFQTGDALGKALASIYASDQMNNSSSSPVCSPPPLTGMSSHWSMSGTNSMSPIVKKSTVHPVHGRMEERLDDAIHVLRNHAESSPLLPPLISPGPMIPRGVVPLPPSHSMDMVGSVGYDSCYMSPMVIPGHLQTSHPCQSSLMPTVDRNRTSQVATEPVQNLQSDKPCGDNESVRDDSGEKFDFHVNSTDTRDSSTKGHPSPSVAPATAPTKGTYMKRSRRLGMMSSDSNDVDDMIDDEDDEDASPETKAQREKVRRQQNNARERLRVKDINEAIKELGQMISIHTGCRQPMTRLMIVQEAVTVITNLEMKLKERNLNPKAACLKRREEEKAEELPGRSTMLPPHPSNTPNKGLDFRLQYQVDVGAHHLYHQVPAPR